VTSFRDPLFVEDELPIRDHIASPSEVESVTGRTHRVGGDPLSPSWFRSNYLVYDSLGNRLQHEKFDRGGQVIRRWLYDSRGKLVQEITYGGSGDVDYRFDVVYDGDDWHEKRMYSPTDRLHYRIVAVRSPDGRLSRANYFDASGGKIRTDSYVYDGLGRLARVDMGQMGACVYEYEGNNLMRRSRDVPGASEYGEVSEFEHDDRGLLTRMSQLHVSVTVLSFTYF
jgi:hypothetical protein